MTSRLPVALLLLAGFSPGLPVAPRWEVLTQEVYVWQRRWTAEVSRAVRQHGGDFETLSVLAAEVTWRGDSPVISRVDLDGEALAGTKRPLTLVFRVGVPPSALAVGAIDTIAEAVREIQRKAAASGLEVRELQLDFDAPESRLLELAALLDAVRAIAGERRLSFTALPAWLDRSAFEDLVRRADSFVLQVHALDRPGPGTKLFDSARAAGWLRRAGRFGVPFRVALPTYAYGVTDRGVLAEVPVPLPLLGPPVEIGADPEALAHLVASLKEQRPPGLSGIAWFRLPVDGDERNWRWPTLSAVMSGRVPVSRLEARVNAGDPGLATVEITNQGDGPADAPAMEALLPGPAAAADGVSGYRAVVDGSRRVVLLEPGSRVLAAGESCVAGWIRLREGLGASEVVAHVSDDRR